MRPNGRTLPLDLPSRPCLFGRDGLPNSGACPCPLHDAPAGRIGPSLGSFHSSWRRALLTGPITGGRAAEPMTAQDTLRELRGFREMGSVLYVAAHPDDENTQLIAYLARGRDYRTAYLSLTRGDGGQNVIGPEFFEELGVIRTQELLAARRLDGGRQFFTRAIDFGFSKNPGETLRIWDRQRVVSDIVRVIRDVPARRDHHALLSPGGRPRAPHGVGDPGRRGVQARGRPQGVPRAARRAGRLAAQANPPERRRIRPGGEAAGPAGSAIEIGGNDPVSGEPLGAIAGRSRSMHKSQGFGNFGGGGGGGPRTESFTLLAGEPATKDIIDGVDTTWARVPGGAEIAKLADEAIAKFDPKDPAASVPAPAGDARAARLAARRPRRGREAPAARSGDPGLPRARGRDEVPQAEVVPGEVLHLRHSATVAAGVPVRWLSVSLPAHGPVGRPADRPDGRPAGQPRRGRRRCPPTPRSASPTGCARSTPPACSGSTSRADRPPGEPAGFPGRATLRGRRPDPGDRRRARAGRRAGPAGPPARGDPAGVAPVPVRRAALRPGVRASGGSRGHGRARRCGRHARTSTRPPAGRSRPRRSRSGWRRPAIARGSRSPSRPRRTGHGRDHRRGPGRRPDLEHRRVVIRHEHIPLQLLQPPARLKAVALDLAIRAVASATSPAPVTAWPRASRRWATRSPGSPARTSRPRSSAASTPW